MTTVQFSPEMEARRERYRSSLLRHTKFIHNTTLWPHQRVWAEALEDTSIKRLLIIAAPKFGKTPTVGLDYLGWRIGRQPDDYHAIYLSNTKTQATKPSVALRDTIKNNPRYRWLYNVKLDPDKGTAEAEWFVKRENVADKDPTLQCCGMFGSILGATVEEVIFDDIADPENMATAYQREKVMEWIMAVPMSRLVPGVSRAVMICTRWHDDDPASHFEKLGWKVLHLPAIDESGESTYPQYWTLGDLEERKIDLGVRGFELQFQGRVLQAEGVVFKREWWKYWTNEGETQAPWLRSQPEHQPILAIVQSWDSVGEQEVLTLKRHRETQVMTFGDFWERADGVVTHSTDGREYKVVRDWQIEGRSRWTGVKYITRHWFEGDLCDVRTRSGRVLVTPNHSLIAEDGSKLLPGDLEHRQNLPAPAWRRVPRIRAKVGAEYSLFTGSLDLAWVCGFFVAEGSVSGGRDTITSFANKKADLLDFVKTTIERELHFRVRIVPAADGVDRAACGWRPVGEYFKRFYDGRKQKIVAADVFSATDDVRKAFLDGYMAGDGHWGAKPEYCTKSPILAQQIAMLFNELYGLKPRFYWRRDKVHIYRVIVGQRVDTLANVVRQVPYSGWVYDIETEEHRFRAGVGGILVSNTAHKGKVTNDYSACETWAVCAGGYYLLNAFRAKMDYPKVKIAFKQIYEQFHPQMVLVEDAASGIDLVLEMKLTTTIPVFPIRVAKDKKARAAAATPVIESGNVHIPREATWLADWLYEHEVFPGGKNDDWVDCTTQFINWARGRFGPTRATLTSVPKTSKWRQ